MMVKSMHSWSIIINITHSKNIKIKSKTKSKIYSKKITIKIHTPIYMILNNLKIIKYYKFGNINIIAKVLSKMIKNHNINVIYT